MAYKQKSGSPFQRNFGSKAPLKRHEEGHEQTNSEFYDKQRLIAQDPNSTDYAGQFGDSGIDKMYMELQDDGTYKAMKNTGIRTFGKNSTAKTAGAFTANQLKNRHVTNEMRDDQARSEHEARQDELQKKFDKSQKKYRKGLSKGGRRAFDEQDDAGNYINRDVYTRQAYS